MCGRFALFSSMDAIKNYYKELVIKGKIEPNYNIVPSMIVPIVIKSSKGYRLFNLKWGFVPYWSDKKGFINIRAETINTKNSFKYAFKNRRCIIPANGFFEWRKKDKQPFFIRLKNRELFSMAGIWEEKNKTFGIITVVSNGFLSDIHGRMPAILKKEDERIWLESNNEKLLSELLKPYPATELESYPVSKRVNSSYENNKNIIDRLIL